VRTPEKQQQTYYLESLTLVKIHILYFETIQFVAQFNTILLLKRRKLKYLDKLFAHYQKALKLP
jgi:hypothetical protein